MDWDDLPRLSAMGRDGPDPWNYDNLAKVIQSQYTLGVVCATATGPAGFMVYCVSDGTGKAARKSGRLHLAAGIVRVQVAPEWRRKGVASFLVNKVDQALIHQFGQRSPAGRLRLHATLNEDWLAGLLFLKGVGFRTPANKDHAIQKGIFDGGKRDGFLLERFSAWPVKATVAAVEPPPAVAPADDRKAA
jgi:ribosomal protein S18 acetylase RimI-like enzyme